MSQQGGRTNLAGIGEINNPDKYRAYLTVVGAVILHLLSGANQLGNIVTYMTSYMRKHVSSGISNSQDMWFTTVTVFSFTLFTIIGGYSVRIIPLRGVLFIGVTLIALGNLLCAFALKVSFMAVVMSISFIQSAGSGFLYTHSIIVASKWFPAHRAFITGLIVAFESIATFGTMLLQTAYLNPENVRADNDGYILDDAVLDRLPVYYRFASLLFYLVGILGVVFTFEAPQSLDFTSQASVSHGDPGIQDKDDESQPLLNSQEEESVVDAATTLGQFIQEDIIPAIDELNDSGESSSQAPANPEPPKKNYYGVRKALKTRMALILFITFGLSTLSSYFISIMAKPFGQFINDDKFLALIVSLGNFANFIGSFFCGKLMDKIKFKHTMLIMNCVVAASYFSLIFCQYWQSRTLYAIWIIVINFSSIGFFTSHLPEVMNKFGAKHSSAIYGVIHIGPVIAALLFSPLLSELISTFAATNILVGQIHYGYYYAFMTIGALNFLSMIILMIFYRTHTVI